jgi:alkanesulfonate monooxygenase SsuD/methylene tetrahydromethanopterin reductase-like flavin-dependent oxidoreductase (luciferase family)
MARQVIQAWVALPWAGPSAYYGADAADRARRLESLGVSGVVQGDHLFVPGPPVDDPVTRMAADCLTVLTTVAAHSQRLGIATLVANVGFHHPLLLLRKFANLAHIHGGSRVYAGLGAGWSRREFEALGLTMAPHAERLERLAETARLARTLFDRGWASEDGTHVTAVDLPLAPAPADPPRLMLGGGSPALLELAGRYADHVDLAPPSHRRSRNELQRPLLTTIDDLAESARAARGSGRSLTTSVLLTAVVFCDARSVRAEEEAICARVGLPWRPLDACPYVLVGEPTRIAEQVRERQERIGLDWMIIPDSAIERFSSNVMSTLS